jgi:hypothetical protein
MRIADGFRPEPGPGSRGLLSPLLRIDTAASSVTRALRIRRMLTETSPTQQARANLFNIDQYAPTR